MERALKGRAPETLNARSEDGALYPPLSHGPYDSPRMSSRTADTPWQLVQKIFRAAPEFVNSQILTDLEGGASGLDLLIEDHPILGQRGVEPRIRRCRAGYLAGVLPDLVTLRLSAGASAPSILSSLFDHLEQCPVEPASISIAGSLDPVAQAAVSGDGDAGAAHQEDAIKRFSERLAVFAAARPFAGDGRLWHACGATAAQELALVLAGFVDF